MPLHASKTRRQLGVLPSLLILALTISLVSIVSLKLHYHLPTPITGKIHPVTGIPTVSESEILKYTKYLSSDIGYRTVGTKEHAAADAWLVEKAHELKRECEEIVRSSNGLRHLECEVWRQEGSGSHRFDMMDKAVYKNYVNLSNIIFRLSNGTEASKAAAVLVNSHLDSTLPSPGAADDALPAALMLDSIRVLINTPTWTPQHAIVYLWNNAEESLQDGSHLFATQSELAPTVRAVINLEAAGVTGPDILFQATSKEMIEAYSHVPWPYGTVLANDVFGSGIIMSDTDFRQFQEYGNLTGLDMAIVGDSYLYHTRKDIVENIQPGVAQHMAENVMALLLHLSSASSPIPNMTLGAYNPPETAFFSILGRFFVMYSFETASVVYNTLLIVSGGIIALFAPATLSVGAIGLGVFGVLGGFVASALSANVAAVIMTKGLDKGMTWFSREWYCLVLYGLPALAGKRLLAFQLLLTFRAAPTTRSTHELSALVALHFIYSIAAVVLQNFGLGSSILFFQWEIATTVALLLHWITNRGSIAGVSFVVYVVGQILPALLGAESAAGLIDIFVPLTGRMGEEAPAEHIIATIAALVSFLGLPFSIPFAHRFGRRVLLTMVIVLYAASAVAMAYFAIFVKPYDTMHPRRVFVIHTEDVTTGEFALHVSASDGAPGLSEIVHEAAGTFGAKEYSSNALAPIVMNEWNADWDVLYPFSQFLTPYKIPLDSPREYVSPWSLAFRVAAKNDVWDLEAGTRSLRLVIDHPGLIWTVIAFDAHVLKWTLDDRPPAAMTRHHVKEASFYGVDQWTLDLVIRVNSTNDKLNVNYVGIQERGMWPGKVKEREGPAMDLFEKLDPWLQESKDVDALLLGCVAGKTSV